MRDVFVSEQVTLRHDGKVFIMRIVPDVSAPPEEMRRHLTALRSSAEPFDRRDAGLIIDVRGAPLMRPEQELAVASERGKLAHDFARVAILVGSSVQRLQAARFLREDATEGKFFESEDEAIAYARGLTR